MRLPSWCLCNSRHNRPPHKQDGPWSFLVLTCTFFQMWLLVGMSRSYGVYLPVLMKEFNEGRDKIALVGSLSGGLAFLLTVIVAWLNSLMDNRIISGIGHVSFIISYIASSFVHKVELLYLTYSCFRAVGMSFVLSSNVLVLLKYFKKHRSLAQGINSSGGALGIMTVPSILQYLLDSVGWRHTFRIQAVAIVISSLLCFVYSPNVDDETHGDQDTTKSSNKAGTINEGLTINENHFVADSKNVDESNDCNTSASGHQNLTDDIIEQQSDNIQNQSNKDKHTDILEDGQEIKEDPASKQEILREKKNIEENTAEDETVEKSTSENSSKDRKFTGFKAMFDLSVWRVQLYTVSVISICIATFSLFSASVHMVKFSEEVGLSPTSASTLYIFLGLASLIARIVGGKLCDISCIKPSMVNMVAELIGAMATFLLTLSTTYIHLAILIFMYGFADGMFRTSTIVLFTTSVARSKSASAFGQGNALTSPFFVAGPAITGLLADEFGEYTNAFYLNGCVLLAAAAVHLIPILFRCSQTSNNFTLAQDVEMRAVQDECNNDNDKQVAILESKTNPSFVKDK